MLIFLSSLPKCRQGSGIISIDTFAEVDMHNLTRITHNPEIMGGKPCIRGMRMTVGTIVGLIGAGKTIDEVLEAYPYLEREDVLQALSYAAWRAEEREVPIAS
jgi:uncharacterized protein (DUF433 family)